jgi:hypothetical protein
VALTKWKNLAEKYSVRQPYRGDWQGLAWFRISGVCSFRGCGKIGTTADYLYLSPPFIAPLQIPWSAMRDPRTDGSKLLFEVAGLTIELPHESLSPAALVKIGLQK